MTTMLLKSEDGGAFATIPLSLDECCVREIWSVLVEQLGFRPYCPAAQAYARTQQSTMVPRRRTL